MDETLEEPVRHGGGMAKAPETVSPGPLVLLDKCAARDSNPEPAD